MTLNEQRVKEVECYITCGNISKKLTDLSGVGTSHNLDQKS